LEALVTVFYSSSEIKHGSESIDQGIGRDNDEQLSMTLDFCNRDFDMDFGVPLPRMQLTRR